MLDVLIFIVVLSVLIIVHEWGHFITARRLGVRVEKFSVGFGPKLFSRVHKGTEFLVSAVPLGGYVKMAGDERNSTTGDPGEFYSQSPGRRALIVFMGPMVNFIFAYLCFYFIFVTGYPILKVENLAQDKIEAIGLEWKDVSGKLIKNDWARPINSTELLITSNLGLDAERMAQIFGENFPKVLPLLQQFPAKIGILVPGHPAQIAGLQVGDRITRINDKAIENWDNLVETVSKSGGVPLAIHYTRNGMDLIATVSPKGKARKNALGEEETIWQIGVQPLEETRLVRYGLGQSFFKAGAEMTSVVTLTFKALYRVFTGTVAARDALAGPIRIFNVIKNAATMGVASLVLVMAVISTSLAIFNVFPIPVLDGGHLLFFLIEKIRGRPLPSKVEENFTRFGLTILLVLMGFVCYNDVIEVGWVDKVVHLFEKVRPK